MDSLTALFNYTGQKLDEFVSSIVVFVPFTCNASSDVTLTRTVTSHTRCTIAMDAANSGVAMAMDNVEMKRCPESAMDVTNSGDLDSDHSAVKSLKKENLNITKQRSMVVKNRGQSECFNLVWSKGSNRKSDFFANRGVIAIKVAPEDVKITKELENMYKQYLNTSNVDGSTSKDYKAIDDSCCLKGSDLTDETVSSIDPVDAETNMSFSSSLWKSITAPLNVMVRVLPSGVFGESGNSPQVAAVCGGTFIDRLIQSLPVSPFGGVNSQSLLLKKDSKLSRRRDLNKYQLSDSKRPRAKSASNRNATDTTRTSELLKETFQQKDLDNFIINAKDSTRSGIMNADSSDRRCFEKPMKY